MVSTHGRGGSRHARCVRVEDDIEDVDHIVAGAAGEHVGIGGQSGDPPVRTQIGQLGDPGLIGVAGQRHHTPAGTPNRSRSPAPEGPDSFQAIQGAHQAGDRRGERRTPQHEDRRAYL